MEPPHFTYTWAMEFLHCPPHLQIVSGISSHPKWATEFSQLSPNIQYDPCDLPLPPKHGNWSGIIRFVWSSDMCGHPMCVVIHCMWSSNVYCQVWSSNACGHPICTVIQYVLSSNLSDHPMCTVIHYVWSSNVRGDPMCAVIECVHHPMCAVIQCVPSSNVCGQPM